MSILSDFEDRVANAVEGLFAGAFRSPVQPVELAKALGRAMDDGRAVGVGKVYAPVTYTVALSREDKRNLGEFTGTLEGELSTYLIGHAEESGYTLTAKPVVHFDVHNDLKLGRFRVSADLTPPSEPAAAPASERRAPAPAPEPVAPAPHPEPAPAPPVIPGEAYVPEIPTPDAPVIPPAGAPPASPLMPEPFPPAPAREPGVATLTMGDEELVLHPPRIIVGRLTGCDICISDRNVSRQHAAFTAISSGWGITDLGSTNGTFVNGERITSHALQDGDVIEVGATRMVFHSGRATR